jgi:predicted HAD superfamily hydrolase
VVHERIARWKQEGADIYFVSDTYLEKALIGQILRKTGIAVEDDHLIVSNEFGVMKRKGRLFRQARAAGALPARVTTHWGNCAIADRSGATWAGIRGMQFREGNADAVEAFLEGFAKQGLRGAAYLAGARRVVRLADSSSSPWVRLGSGYAGIVALLFLSWIVQRCRRHGVKRVFLLARDGWMLKRISEETPARKLCADLSFHYLSVSRRAMGVDSSAEGDQELRDAYLDQERFFTDEPVAVVDVGWRGSLVRVLSAARRRAGGRRSLESLRRV